MSTMLATYGVPHSTPTRPLPQAAHLEHAVAERVQQHVWRHDQHVYLLQQLYPALPVPLGDMRVVDAAVVRLGAEAIRLA
jgi:hypothetical protein